MLLDIIIVWCCFQVGQWQGVCSLAGQVSFGRSSENSQLLLHSLLYFLGKMWGHALWGLQHSSQAMGKFERLIKMKLRAQITTSTELEQMINSESVHSTGLSVVLMCGRRALGPGLAESQIGVNMHGNGVCTGACCLNGAFCMSSPSVRWTGKILAHSL